MQERPLPLVILVNELPATGKTTLAQQLDGATLALLFMPLGEPPRLILTQEPGAIIAQSPDDLFR